MGTQGIDFQEFDRPCTPQDIHEALYSKAGMKKNAWEGLIGLMGKMGKIKISF